MTKDNWIKAFREKFRYWDLTAIDDLKEVESFISQVEKDAINRLNHDHEILVKTILETKNKEIEDAKSESYTNGFREGFDAGVEKTNKRWRLKSGKKDDKIKG